MTERPHESREHRQIDSALARVEQYYDRQHPPQQKQLNADAAEAHDLDWLFRRNIED